LRWLKWLDSRCPPLRHLLLHAYRFAAELQLSPAEISFVLRRLRHARSFLVFGVGRDTPLWATLGPPSTYFIEHNPRWMRSYARFASRFHAVTYSTEVDRYRELLDDTAALEMSLPAAVRDGDWDVVLVDAPPGFQSGTPGRMQSIYEAARLVRPGGDVLVHDMDREPEQVFAARYLGAMKKRTGRLGHFRATWAVWPPPAGRKGTSRISSLAPRFKRAIGPDRLIPYYHDSQVEINLVNFSGLMSLRPRHEREVLLVRDTWFAGPPMLSAARRRVQSPRHFRQVYHLSNTLEDHHARKRMGLNSHYINFGCFIDDEVFQPVPGAPKVFDAAMVARFSWFRGDQLKRHYLANGVERLALLSPIGGYESQYYRDHYYRRPNCALNNLHRLEAERVAAVLRRAHCGLILSEVEGVCRASCEYLACGLPVISTTSRGGRDVWYDEDNAIIVPPIADAVAAAVEELRRHPRDSQQIRKGYLARAGVFRQRFVNQVLAPIFQDFEVGRDPQEVFDAHPIRWW